MTGNHYIIRGGIEGRERLRLLARVMRPTTLKLLQTVGVDEGASCLDVGCGGGDVTVELAKLVGPAGRAVGSDIDTVKLDIAREEAAAQEVRNIEFRQLDICKANGAEQFDLIYTRFLLTHLPEPERALSKIWSLLRPGGVAIVEDIDFNGYFCHPEMDAFQHYIRFYTETVYRRGGDPNIGPRLPRMLGDAGLDQIEMNVVQPASRNGEVKLVTPLTMENIAKAVVAEGVATAEQVDDVVDALYTAANDDTTVLSIPRVVQAWGRRH